MQFNNTKKNHIDVRTFHSSTHESSSVHRRMNRSLQNPITVAGDRKKLGRRRDPVEIRDEDCSVR